MLFDLFSKSKNKSWYASQLNSSDKKRLVTFAKLLLGLMTLHVGIITVTEDWSLWTSTWYTVVTIATIGFGDQVPTTWMGQAATAILMCFAGVVVFAVATGDYVAYQLSKKDRMIKGRWNWEMKNHILIINAPAQGGERYLSIIIDEMKKTPELGKLPVQILTKRFVNGLPESIKDKGAVHFHGSPTSATGLANASAMYAKHILVLADDYNDPSTDCRTLDVLDRLKEMGTEANIIAEYVSDHNGERFKKYASAVMRPVRAFPEIMCRAMIDPGAEKILQNLFVHDGDFIKRYKVQCNGVSWTSVSTAILQADMGTPIAYKNLDDDLVMLPRGSDTICMKYLYIMVKDDNVPIPNDITLAIDKLIK